MICKHFSFIMPSLRDLYSAIGLVYYNHYLPSGLSVLELLTYPFSGSIFYRSGIFAVHVGRCQFLEARRADMIVAKCIYQPIVKTLKGWHYCSKLHGVAMA